MADQTLDKTVAQIVLAASACVCLGILLVTARTLGGQGQSSIFIDAIAIALLAIAAAVAADSRRHRRMVAVFCVAACGLLAVLGGAMSERSGPLPGPAIFAWTRGLLLLCAVMAASALARTSATGGGARGALGFCSAGWAAVLIMERLL